MLSALLSIQYISNKLSLEMNFEMKLTFELWIGIERRMAFMPALLLNFQLYNCEFLRFEAQNVA